MIDRRTGSRPIRAAAAALVLALVAVGGPTAAASAQDAFDCGAPVVDTSGRIDVTEVEAAIDRVDPEAVVVVRVFDEVPGGDLPAAIDDIVAACFATDEATVDPDVIVLGLSVGDEMSDVLVGPGWGAAVSDPVALRTEVMGEPFAAGDFTGGLVAAVTEIAAGVDVQLAEGGFGPVEAADPDEVEDDAEAATGSPEGDGQSGLAVAGGLAAIALGGGAYYAIGRHRRLVAARRELDAALVGPQLRQGTLRERDAGLSAEAEMWTKVSTGETSARLEELMTLVGQSRAAVDQSQAVLRRLLPDGPAEAGREALERSRERVVELNAALDGHDTNLDRLGRFEAHLDHLSVAAPEKTAVLNEELDEVYRLADQREDEGWAVQEMRAELGVIGETLNGLDFDRLELDLLQLSHQVEDVEARLFSLDHQLETLPGRADSLRTWSQAQADATGVELRRIDNIRRQFAGLAARHAVESWQWAADHTETANEHLEAAARVRIRVETDMLATDRMEGVDRLDAAARFDAAGRELQTVGLQMVTADRLLDQVDDLIIDLERAAEEGPRLVAEGHDVLRNLTDFVAAHRGDLEPDVVAAPERLATALAGLEHQLAMPKPNHLRLTETADRINRQLDDLLAGAQEQHLRMESLRRELRRETERASRAVARARRALGWQLLPSRDGLALDGLEQQLAALPPDLDDALGQVGQIADQALRVHERLIARRRRRARAARAGSIGGGFGGGATRSGGFGGGRSSSRAGGGRSFGGRSSAGGGRSFGGGRSSGRF